MTDGTADLPEGSRFGKYEIRTKLGQGGMGAVFEAYDTVMDRVVALKILSPHLSNDPSFRTRFIRESRAAAKLEEPHVIPIHNSGDVDGTLFIDMRRVQGTDLGTLLKDGPLPAERAVAINSQIASALDAAHAAGLIHRDVKPENILVTPNGFAYLVDFGIAEAHGETRLTKAGGFIGSLPYMAPERFSGEPVTAATDIYSLGCVLFESLTGTAPFPSTSTPQAIAAHTTMPSPRPSEANPKVPASFDAVIARALAKEPDDRYGTAGAFGRAAQRALQAAPAPATVVDATLPGAPPAMPTVAHTAGPTYPSAPGGEPAHQQQRPASGRPNWLVPSLVAAAVAIVVVAVGIGFLALRDRQDTADDGPRVGPTTTAGTSPRTTNTAGPTGSPTPRQAVTPPLVQGPDVYDESCGDGIAHPTATGWASHAGRGTPETSCYFADSVLKAYWAQYPAPSRDSRTVLAAGRVPCPTTGSNCSGTDYVMECQALGSEDWITCTGGSNARVYLY